MGTNGVVSIRVEALGVSITIVDGSIAIEQTRTEVPAAGAGPKVDHGLAAATNGAVPASAVVTERVALPMGVDESTVWEDSGGADSASVNASHRPSPPGRKGPTGLPGDSGKGQEAGSGQTVWTEEEIEKLRALYPTHSAGAIAVELGRRLNSVRAKAQHLGLRKDGPPAVTVSSSPREAKPAPKPRSLSAAVTADLAPVPGFSSVPLLDHHPGQCRWIISDVWPVVYCGAPVVDSSSWCEQHSRRVFKPSMAARDSKEPHAQPLYRNLLKVW